jgi:hypothetical protein
VRPRGRRALLTFITLGVMGMAVLAPTALAYYRCDMMGTMASPCCPGEGASQEPGAPRLQRTPCCTKVVVTLDRAPSDLTGPDQPLPLPVVAPPVTLAFTPPPADDRPMPAPVPANTGPPILLRTCSLLI